MRITKLEIKNYKNLDATLNHSSDIIAIIGNNGSGKSNLLEAVSHIFRSLYVGKYKIDFDYCIEYETSKKSKVKIEKIGKDRTYFLDNISVSDITNYLPQKVVAIYSGEEARLFDDCFGPFYLEFVNNINKAQLQGTEYSELPRMLFLNKFYWNISLLSLLVSDSEDNKKFVEEVLKIKQIDKIKIDFVKRNYEKYNDNKALRLVRDIDIKAEYDLTDFKNILSEKGHIADDLYKYLYLAYSPKDSKIINDIVIEFNTNLTVADLSEGEKKLLLIKGALEFAGQEDSIFILDEPDSHIHINNKEQITKSFEPYQHNRQIIITTHSPTLTQCLKDENVYMLNSGKVEDKNRQEIIQDVTGEFWNKHQQNSFLSSKKPIILLVEGKEDKIHINNAFNHFKNEFPKLDFEIFNMGSADNIEHFAKGLYGSEIINEKLYVCILDDDAKGTEICTELKKSFKNINGFEVFKYPKKIVNPNHKGSFTVENLFEPLLYEKAFKEIINNFQFEYKSIDEISKNIQTKAKGRLSGLSKDFEKEDFKNFKFVFEEINKYYIDFSTVEEVLTANPSESDINVTATVTPQNEEVKVSEQEQPIIEVVEQKVAPTEIIPILKHVNLTNKKSGRTVTEKQHLTNKPPYVKKMYNLLKEEILRKDQTIEVKPLVTYIAFKRDKRNIFDIQIQGKKIILWVNKYKGDLPVTLSFVFNDCAGKGHQGNGDYEKHFTEENEVVSFIKNNTIENILNL